MMTPTLLDLAAITGLHPHVMVYSTADLLEPILSPNYTKGNKNCTNWIKTHFAYTRSSSKAPRGSINDVAYTEHLAFLQMWLFKCLTYLKCGQTTKEVQPLAEALVDCQVVALGLIFLAYLYR
ncbi:unnamed protein product [Prunus armeniaca]